MKSHKTIRNIHLLQHILSKFIALHFFFFFVIKSLPYVLCPMKSNKRLVTIQIEISTTTYNFYYISDNTVSII